MNEKALLRRIAGLVRAVCPILVTLSTLLLVSSAAAHIASYLRPQMPPDILMFPIHLVAMVLLAMVVLSSLLLELITKLYLGIHETGLAAAFSESSKSLKVTTGFPIWARMLLWALSAYTAVIFILVFLDPEAWGKGAHAARIGWRHFSSGWFLVGYMGLIFFAIAFPTRWSQIESSITVGRRESIEPDDT